MLQETNLETALKKVLAGKQVLAAVKKENATRYTFRSLNETLKKHIFLINVPAVEDPDFKEKVTEMVQSVPAAAKRIKKSRGIAQDYV